MRRNQRGMTLMSFIVVLAVVGFFIYVAMKLVPMYHEYYSLKTVLKGMSQDAEIAQKDPATLKTLFFRRMDMNMSQNIKPQHVRIEKSGSGQLISVNYEVRVPMLFNLDVVGKFSASQDLSRAAAAGQ